MHTPNFHGPTVPVFSGQGSGKTSLRQAHDQAVRDASSDLGLLLATSCLDAFFAELSSLSPEELSQTGICVSDFENPQSLISPPPKYTKNQIVSGTSLFLAQTLRYQSYVQSTFGFPHCFRDILHPNSYHGVGVLGLSSGIFPACVVAASHNMLMYISIAVQVFRLVFWIGFRALQFTRKILADIVTLPCLPVCVTTILDDRCSTVSGRPDVLQRLSTSISQFCTVHPTTVNALYHSPLHLKDTREHVLADIARRQIIFPDYHQLHCPLRSTISGTLAQASDRHPSLAHLVVDMVLVERVNWDLVVKEVSSCVPADVSLQIINVGPSSAVVRTLEKALSGRAIICADAPAYSDQEPRVQSAPKQEPVAIVGMAVRAPGASNADELWEILESGISTLSAIPQDRFNLSMQVDHDNVGDHGLKVQTGNFISGHDEFDHKFFKVSPREARSMDPQQRVLLHTAYEALENAGYVPDATPSFRRDTFGCYIGAATQDYVDNLRDEIDIHYSTGTLRAFLSGRISYYMQFGGPSIVVDTACSSSIVAIYQACRALTNRDCNAALAGGVNIMSSADMFVGLERGHFLSPSGECKAFDGTADGYSRGEGCCLFVLKRLSDAVAENDNIIGVIRGVEVNQSGLAHSITHPHSPTQATLLTQLLASSGVEASSVSVVEAHGTGTQAGDSCELESIRSVLAQGRKRDNPLHVTSIKANIGHLEAASGAAGLCKLILMLQQNLIPAQISLKTLNPRIAPLESDNTVIDTSPATWTSGSSPRIAILNNFGAAGSNGALLLEEYVAPRHSNSQAVSVVFGISAKSAGALDKMRMQYIRWLRDARNHKVSLCDIAYTATARKQLYPFRISVTADSKEQLIRALGAASPTHVERHGYQLVFVFSGQGCQYLGMGASLYAASPVFRSCIDRCHAYLLTLGYSGVLPIVVPHATCDVLSPDAEFEANQCAVLALEFALASLWQHWGLVPSGVIGHSLGEYAAMVIAEVLTIETALSIVAKRARLMVQVCALGNTGMLAVGIGSDQAQTVLAKCESVSDVSVSCINTDSSCVLSGPLTQLRTLSTYLSGVCDCKTVLLDVPLGYHSAAMDPILDELTEHVAMLPLNPPSIPVASNVYGTVVLPGDWTTFRHDYFAQHCRQPVLFANGLRMLNQHLSPDNIGAWIEVGPHTPCLPMVESTLRLGDHTLLLPTLRKSMDSWNTISSSLSRLYNTAFHVDWRKVFAELCPTTCVDLPSYPFGVQRFWVPHRDRPNSTTTELQPPFPEPTNHPMLSSWSQIPSYHNGNVAIFDTPIRVLAQYIEGHKVGGHALCPASVYLEQALAGAALAQRHLSFDFGRCMPILRGVRFSRPLVYRTDVPRIVRIYITIHEDGTGTFSVSSRLVSSREESVHVHGEIRFSSIRETTTNLALELPAIARVAQAVTNSRAVGHAETFSTRTAYDVVLPHYHTIQSLTVNGDEVTGVAQISLPTAPSSRIFVAQALFIDTLLHVAGDISDAYICSEVGKQSYGISLESLVFSDICAVRDSEPQVVVAHLQDVQFRRVRLASLSRGLSLAADTTSAKTRPRTDSNAIMTPVSPRSVIFSRSRSNTQSDLFRGTNTTGHDVHSHTGGYSSPSTPLSPTTLVSDHGAADDGNADADDVDRIRMIMAEVLGISACQEIEDDSDFKSLGLDSLGSIEAQQALKEGLKTNVPHDIFSICPTFMSLCEFFTTRTTKNGFDAPVEINDALSDEVQRDIDTHVDTSVVDGISPLFLIHDGSGLVTYYGRLSSLNRNVWGLSDPRFFLKDHWKSVDEMANAYTQIIEKYAGDALILGGWSFGGVVAFEVAQRLAARGLEVKGVILIDSPAPSTPVPLSDPIINFITRYEERNTNSLIAPLIREHFRRNSQILRTFRPTKRSNVTLAFLRSRKGFSAAETIDDVAAWFKERDDPDAAVGPWKTFVVGPIKVWDIPGHHFEPFSPENVSAYWGMSFQVQQTSAQLDNACRYLDGLSLKLDI
ncbi:putative polyketide synthase [Phlebopus sp. FC_14]|nr:putative polyketide synthase [Phlebopus sp. FC_14]